MSDETQRRIGRMEGHIDGIRSDIGKIETKQSETFEKLGSMNAELLTAIGKKGCPEEPRIDAVETRVDVIEEEADQAAEVKVGKARDWRRLAFQILAGMGVVAGVAVCTLILRKVLNGLITP